MAQPSLQILSVLEKIVRYIEEAECAQSATRLKRALGISDSDFDEAAEWGCSKKHLKRAPGNVYSLLKSFNIPESAYYQVVLDSICSVWMEDGYAPNEFAARITAKDDSKIAGRWTRPDVTLVSHKKFSWTVGNEFDVVTFEVKRPDEINVIGVFEALSHVTAATKAYVVFPVNFSEWSERYPQQGARITDECVRHGVGLLCIENLHLTKEPKIIVQAARKTIDYKRCSEFLDAVMPNDIKGVIAAWKS
ncbi:hypothetical protein [Brevundimonas sp. R86498]|uniref:hypothetical protein n=1 Tax=Brevundimonas sp. R86498 TaxID=3093845 RepID=UPI0037C8E816